MRKLLFLAGIIGVVFYSCENSPSFPIVPVITFKSVNKTTIKQVTDSVQLVFGFTDGDGDLGLNQGDTSTDTYVTDTRKPPYTYAYRIPFIPSGGLVKDISGQVTITLPGVYCIPNKTLDTIVYKIQVKDRAGHLSNIISSPPIKVICD